MQSRQKNITADLIDGNVLSERSIDAESKTCQTRLFDIAKTFTVDLLRVQPFEAAEESREKSAISVKRTVTSHSHVKVFTPQKKQLSRMVVSGLDHRGIVQAARIEAHPTHVFARLLQFIQLQSKDPKRQ
jgi:hypothetical protein